MSKISAQINTGTGINIKKNENKKTVKSIIEVYYIAFKKDGAVKKNNQYADMSDGNKIFKSYNKKGKLLEIIRLNNNDTVKRISYVFQKGYLKEKKIFGTKNKLLKTVKYIYDTTGKLYLEETYSDKEKVSTDTLKYNQHGIQKFKIISDAGGKLLMTKGYNYNINGNIIEFSSFNYFTDDYTRITYKYNLQGKITEKITEINDYLNEKITFKYDSNGNITEKTKHDYTGSLVYKKTFKYEFDKDNNWIKKIIYKEGIPQYIVERKIQYY